MLKRILFLTVASFGLICSELDVGTDIDKIGNVVLDGVVQPGWTYEDASFKSSPPQGEIYFYAKGLNVLGPTFEVTEFNHEDRYKEDSHKWVFMNVTIDEKINGLLKDYTAYKVTQECIDRAGGATIHMNITFTSLICAPISINWLKICGEPTETRESLTIGLSPKSSEVVTNGIVTAKFDGNTKDEFFKVSSNAVNTSFYLYHTTSFMKTYYSHPYIITDHEVMYPTLTGTMTEIGWLEGDILELVVTYNCLVNDGTREELILVIELPYFHDLEIHFFKTCGQTKESIIKLRTILYVLGLGLVGYIAFHFYTQYKNEEKILDFSNLSESLKNCSAYFRTLFSNFRKKPAEDKNLESDDDGLNGLNVHTMYGTA